MRCTWLRAPAAAIALAGALSSCGAPPSPSATKAAPAAVATETQRPDPVIEPWNFGETRGECIDLGTHRLHSTLRDPVIRERMMVFLPTALDHYRGAIIPLPPADGPIEVFLFGTREDWLDYTRERLPREASMYERIGRGGFTVDGDAVLYDIGRWDTFTIAAHEGWHAYTQRVFRNPLPVWLEEGIACFMEGVRGGVNGGPPTFIPWRNFERYGELRDVVSRGRFVSLTELVEGTPQDYLANGRRTLLGYYAQTWALVHFLNEGEGGRYRPGLERILRDAIDGRISSTIWESSRAGSRGERRMAIGRQVGPAVLREYFNADLDEIAAQYEAFVKALARRGNGERLWRGERPVTDPEVAAERTAPTGESASGATSAPR